MIRSQIQKIGDNLHKYHIEMEDESLHRNVYRANLELGYFLEVVEHLGYSPKVFLCYKSKNTRYSLSTEENHFLSQIVMLCFKDTKNFDDLEYAVCQ